ncbi:hypothetical protein [Neptunomonas marina]|uniref:Nuclear transport factor 2 family protein n=1 Tax=Neptunomonas marina TaxID=1815562 RepID=A0A437QCP7_9GAMM|nr:hypothetical protein [Neptunomonas marina]RVU32215.1 hypothetical protein EOE65_00755 [Neptunomonas marina]
MKATLTPARTLIALTLSLQVLTVSAQTSPETPAPQAQINSLSPSYDKEARFQLSENDVKSFIYQWFAAFDHQREAGFFLNRLASPIDLTYPGTPLRSETDFLRWYGNVTQNIAWNSHSIKSLTVTGDQQTGWQVALQVRWQAREHTGKKYDLVVAQQLKVIRVGDLLKIAQLQSKLVEG